MLKGDLTSTAIAPLLLELATSNSTGCLVINDGNGEEAVVYLKSGQLCAVSVPGTRPQLGAKLISSGALAPEALAEALEAQASELQGWRLGELLVHLGYVDPPVVEAFVREQVHEAMWDLMRWTEGRWKFRRSAKLRVDVGPPMQIAELLESLRSRGVEWETISVVVHGPMAVPRLSASDGVAPETTLDNDAWSMLCKIDGDRTVDELARDCGYTLFEAGQVIVSLVQAGLVEIEEYVDLEGSQPYGASTLTAAFAGEPVDDARADGVDDPDPLSRLARLVSEGGLDADAADGGGSDGAAVVAPAQRTAEPDLGYPLTMSLHRDHTESFAASIARVSTALTDVLGETPAAIDDIDPLMETRKATRSHTSTDDPEWQRRRRLRSAAAAELAGAQELAEALRPDHDFVGELPDAPPKLKDIATERARVAAREAEAHARHAEQAQRHAAEDAARDAAERFARAAAEQAERHAAEEAAGLAAAEASRVEAERARHEAEERAAAEQAARLAAEAAELVAASHAARLAAERAAAETVAWQEYRQREEAERAAAERAARIAAEEAARQEAARVTAEQAARQAAEDAARIAAEQAARQAAEDAARLAAEKAERAARRKAEKAAADEAARLADEAAAATAMLIELNATAAAPEPVEPVTQAIPEPVAEIEPPQPVGEPALADITDTASLLRELSSLTIEEDEGWAAGRPTPSPRRPNTNGDAKKVKKKIGLFGL